MTTANEIRSMFGVCVTSYRPNMVREWDYRDFRFCQFNYTDANGCVKTRRFSGDEIDGMNEASILTKVEGPNDQFGDPTYEYRRFRFDRMTDVVVK